MRKELFDEHPLCVLCLEETPRRFTIATVRDHIVALAHGGTDTRDNTQPLCERHNKQKAARESSLSRGGA